MKRFYLVVLLATFSFLAACNNSGTSTPNPTAPANPANFSATALSSSEIKLEWTAVAGATAYVLERQSNGGTFTQVTKPAATVTVYTDSGLNAATPYTYRIKTVNGSQSSSGMQANATTQAAGGPDFNLSLASPTLTLTPGGSSTVNVTLTRTGGFADGVQLSLEGTITGTTTDKVSGTFTPNPATATTSTLSLTVGTSVPAGTYTLTIHGVAGSQNKTTELALTITAAKTVLLVDDDHSENNFQNSTTLSKSDTLFRTLLTGKGYDVYVVKDPAINQTADGPTLQAMENYSTVIWYTADEYDATSTNGNKATISSTDEISLQAFLDLGNRKLLAFSQDYPYALTPNGDGTKSNAFLLDTFGIERAASSCSLSSYSVAGSGLSLDIANAAVIGQSLTTFKVAAGAETLLTTDTAYRLGRCDIDATVAEAVAVGKKNVGAAASSKAILLGFPFENIADVAGNSKAALFQKLLDY